MGHKVHYPFLANARIVDVCNVMTVAYYLAMDCQIEDVQTTLEKMKSYRYVYDWDLKIDEFSNDKITYTFRNYPTVIYYAISKTRKEWMDLYKELTNMFIRKH